MDWQPLQMPCFERPDGSDDPEPWLTRFRRWLARALVWAGSARPVASSISQQLRARPQPPADIWGEDPERQRVARIVCHNAKEFIVWPNDHFIPDDPAELVFYEHEDGLDYTAMIINLEDQLNISIPDEEAGTLSNRTLGQVVDWLQERMAASVGT